MCAVLTKEHGILKKQYFHGFSQLIRCYACNSYKQQLYHSLLSWDSAYI